MNSKSNMIGALGARFLIFGCVVFFSLLCGQNSCPMEMDSDSVHLHPFYTQN